MIIMTTWSVHVNINVDNIFLARINPLSTYVAVDFGANEKCREEVVSGFLVIEFSK
jgi:hypothetical protein